MKNLMKNLHILLAAALSVPGALFSTSAASAQASPYYFTNFNLAGGDGASTLVQGISSTGVVVGEDYSRTSGISNFVGTPGAFTTPRLPYSFPTANGINASGQIVGSDGSRGSFLFSSANGSSTVLPLADPNSLAQYANAINDSGVIVGLYYHSDESTVSGFVDTNGSFTTLDAAGIPMQTYAQGINNNGLVIGNYSIPNGSQTQGFTYDTRTGTYSQLANPNISNLDFAQFLGINDSNIAVGYYQTTAGFQHGFLYNVNTQAYTFLDDPDVAPSSIAFPSASLMQITGINDSGEIAGYFTNSANQQVGFVADTGAAPVPEASSVVSLGLLLTLGLGGAWAAKQRKAAFKETL